MDLSGNTELRWLSAVLSDMREAAQGADFLVVGAIARDLLLHYGYGVPITRATTDVDLGVAVAGWREFRQLRDALLESANFEAGRPASHRFVSSTKTISSTRPPVPGLPATMPLDVLSATANNHAAFSTPLKPFLKLKRMSAETYTWCRKSGATLRNFLDDLAVSSMALGTQDISKQINESTGIHVSFAIIGTTVSVFEERRSDIRPPRVGPSDITLFPSFIAGCA